MGATRGTDNPLLQAPAIMGSIQLFSSPRYLWYCILSGVKTAYRSPSLVDHAIVRCYEEEVGMTIDVHGFGVHPL